MTRTLEILEEALEEAEEAARWYAERSETAAVGFADELDAASRWRLWALVRWAGRDASGHTAFVLRPEVVEALQRLGYGQGGRGIKHKQGH